MTIAVFSRAIMPSPGGCRSSRSMAHSRIPPVSYGLGQRFTRTEPDARSNLCLTLSTAQFYSTLTLTGSNVTPELLLTSLHRCLRPPDDSHSAGSRDEASHMFYGACSGGTFSPEVRLGSERLYSSLLLQAMTASIGEIPFSDVEADASDDFGVGPGRSRADERSVCACRDR